MNKNSDIAGVYAAQGALFARLESARSADDIAAGQIVENYLHTPKLRQGYFQLHNRRYIGNKHRLIEWIFSVLGKACVGDSFMDIFAGTGVVSAVACRHYGKVILNDLLFSNQVIYQAFFGDAAWDEAKVARLIAGYNDIKGIDLAENYFSQHFGGKYFSQQAAKVIGFIRQDIEGRVAELTAREYHILLASLLYSVDKIANTVGHYDAYFKKDSVQDHFVMRPIDPIGGADVCIFREDANRLAKQVQADIVYIDPPYNSRQYSRFYHVLETLTKWDKPTLHGVALKPPPENMSDYCRTSARMKFAQLVEDLDAKSIVVSYNNTYASKSSSSKNRIGLEEIHGMLAKRGETTVYEKHYRHFNAGNTRFNNHKEYLFVTRVEH